MRALFRKIRGWRFRYEPLIKILIHRDRILRNLHEFQATNPGVEIAPVLKSNAYGHGLVQVAQILEGERLPFLCVDSYVEALILRNEGVKTPLLIIGYTPLENIEHSKLKNVAFCITSIEELYRLSAKCRKPVTIHLKIDTGMHRQGIFPQELGEALKLVARNKKIALEGVYSHLADADTWNSPLTKKQIDAWNDAVRDVRQEIPGVRWFHLANTVGSQYAKLINANSMRLGIGLYGIHPHTTTASENYTAHRANSPFGVGVNPGAERGYSLSAQNSQNPRSGIGAVNLLPTLEMRTRITSVRQIFYGENVGYNATFTAKRGMTVATIPVGYAEGLDRRLSNVGTVTVAGVECPFVGRINMNMTSIDVSRVPNPKIDDEVVVISADHNAQNSIEKMAELCETIPYELLIRIPAQIRRVIYP